MYGYWDPWLTIVCF